MYHKQKELFAMTKPFQTKPLKNFKNTTTHKKTTHQDKCDA